MITLDTTPMDGAEFLRIRKDSGITMQALADTLGINYTTVARYQSGKLAVPIPIALAMRQIDQMKESDDA